MKSAIVAFLFLIFAAVLHAQSPMEKQLFDLVNHEREKAGLSKLEWSDLAANAARQHARMLAEKNELSHQFTGEPSLPERLGATGVRFTSAAENVARTEHIEDVHLALMNSPGHRANILSPKYNSAGIGVVEEKGRIFVTQDFIFRVPTYTEEQFSAAISEELNQNRKATGLKELDTSSDSYLHGLACSTDGNASSLAGNVSGSYVVVFNSSEPHHLPEQMQKAAMNMNYRRIRYGACFRPDKEHGYGNFWVVAVFGG